MSYLRFIRCIRCLPCMVILLLLQGQESAQLEAAVASPAVSSQVRELSNALAELRHVTANHEKELYVLQEKLQTQEAVAEDLYREETQVQQQVQELMKLKATAMQRLGSVEGAVPLLHGDISALKKHLESQGAALVEMQSQLAHCQELMAQQAKVSQHLQQAMQGLTAALQPEPTAVVAATAAKGESRVEGKGESTGETYCVKVGDSLGEIARRYGIKVKEIQSLNGLTSDKIRVGQTLNLPKPS